MLRALLVGGCLLLPALSSGANAPAVINIDDPSLIEGRNWKPDVDDVTSRHGAAFGSVIRLRENFKDQVVSSVSEL